MPLTADLPAGGYFVLEARADAGQGRFTVTRESFYALGRGYTAWQRYDHNRIDLVAERSTYKPGDTARIMIQSPWEQATRAGDDRARGRPHASPVRADLHAAVDRHPDRRRRHPEHLRVGAARQGTHQAARRTPATKEDDPSDPGKPSFRLGYVQLGVEDDEQAADRRGRREQGRVPAGQHRDRHARREGPAGPRRRERSHAVGRRLRRAVADRVSARPTCSARSTCRRRCRS